MSTLCVISNVLITGNHDKNSKNREFPLWLSRLRIRHSVHEDVGSIPGFAQWVKDPVLPQAVVKMTDAADISYCCVCGVGQQLQLQFNP